MIKLHRNRVTHNFEGSLDSIIICNEFIEEFFPELNDPSSYCNDAILLMSDEPFKDSIFIRLINCDNRIFIEGTQFTLRNNEAEFFFDIFHTGEFYIRIDKI